MVGGPGKQHGATVPERKGLGPCNSSQGLSCAIHQTYPEVCFNPLGGSQANQGDTIKFNPQHDLYLFLYFYTFYWTKVSIHLKTGKILPVALHNACVDIH